MLGDLTSGLVSDGLQTILNNTIFRLVYYIAAAVCWVIGILYDLFEVMAGLVKVTYDGDKQYLINIFFGNSTVSKAYWGMAMIGFVLCFAFTIIAVIRKMMDLEGKVQATLGVIIGNCVKSIATIALMSAFMLALLNMTNVLIQQVMYIFNNADDLGKEQTITYTDEEYAAMARVLNTIGNYSLNPAWTSRYNINSCFNDFREDLQWLYDQGVFDVYYDDDTINHTSWQAELEQIVYTVDLTEDLPLNTYNENLQAALEHTVEVMQTDKKFKPISSYTRSTVSGTETVPLDRILFLSCTMRAANNASFNENPSFTDALRGPYYTGAKSIYDYDSVVSDFNIGLATDYILLFIVGWAMVKDLLEIIFTCVSRIFNMILLYLVSPPLIAAAPLDGGGKLKQWITAMIVQSFGVFGTIVAMRVMMLLVPIMMSSELVLFDNVLLNIFGKIILIVGALEVEKKAISLITGILADSAGWQAINAGDMKDTARGFMRDMVNTGLGAGRFAGSTVKGAFKTGKIAGKGLWKGGKAVGHGASWANGKVFSMFGLSRDKYKSPTDAEKKDTANPALNPQKAADGLQTEQQAQNPQLSPQKAADGLQTEQQAQNPQPRKRAKSSPAVRNKGRINSNERNRERINPYEGTEMKDMSGSASNPQKVNPSQPVNPQQPVSPLKWDKGKDPLSNSVDVQNGLPKSPVKVPPDIKK